MQLSWQAALPLLQVPDLAGVLGERDDCYVLSGLDKPMSKVRFEPVTPPKAIEALKAKGK